MKEQVCRIVLVPTPRQSFDEVVIPHLAAARRLARWLMRNEEDAEDALQESALRAFRYFRTFAGGDGRAWFLSIVRNTCRGWRVRPIDAVMDPFDEEQHSTLRCKSDPEVLMHNNDAAALITCAMSHVPDRVRELLVLREVEGLSYRELADVMHLPIGTVMSRLSRARQAFRGAMTATLQQYGIPRWHILAYERAARPERGLRDGSWDARVVKRRAIARRPRHMAVSHRLG